MEYQHMPENKEGQKELLKKMLNENEGGRLTERDLLNALDALRKKTGAWLETFLNNNIAMCRTPEGKN